MKFRCFLFFLLGLLCDSNLSAQSETRPVFGIPSFQFPWLNPAWSFTKNSEATLISGYQYAERGNDRRQNASIQLMLRHNFDSARRWSAGLAVTHGNGFDQLSTSALLSAARNWRLDYDRYLVIGAAAGILNHYSIKTQGATVKNANIPVFDLGAGFYGKLFRIGISGKSIGDPTVTKNNTLVRENGWIAVQGSYRFEFDRQMHLTLEANAQAGKSGNLAVSTATLGFGEAFCFGIGGMGSSGGNWSKSDIVSFIGFGNYNWQLRLGYFYAGNAVPQFNPLTGSSSMLQVGFHYKPGNAVKGLAQSIVCPQW